MNEFIVEGITAGLVFGTIYTLIRSHQTNKIKELENILLTIVQTKIDNLKKELLKGEKYYVNERIDDIKLNLSKVKLNKHNEKLYNEIKMEINELEKAA